MIEAGKIAALWPKNDYGWSIAPSGLGWIAEGARARIGEWARIDEGARIGEGAIIDARARIGEGAIIDEGARIGARAIIDARARIGAQARIGANASWALDLGFADGYRKCIANVNGVAYIGAGCRGFTVAEALRHWDNKPDRIETMCLMQSAIYLAGYHGLVFE